MLVTRFQNKTAVRSRSGSSNSRAAICCARLPTARSRRSCGVKKNSAASLAEKKAELHSSRPIVSSQGICSSGMAALLFAAHRLATRHVKRRYGRNQHGRRGKAVCRRNHQEHAGRIVLQKTCNGPKRQKRA